MAGGGIIYSSMTEELKIQLAKANMQGLFRAFDWLIKHYEAENHHELLLLMHAIEFRGRIEKLLLKKQKNYTLSLSDVSALAFAQIWHTDYMHLAEYEQKVIFSINEQIDKHRKQLNTQPYEPAN